MATHTEQLVTEYVQLADRIAADTERQKTIKTILTELGEGRHDIGEHAVTITTSRRFNQQRAEQIYPIRRFPHYYTLTLDRKSLEKAIPPTEFDQLKDNTTPTVTIR